MNHCGWIDTHAHLYDSAFDADRVQIIKQAVNMGVHTMLLPNVDVSTVMALHQIVSQFPTHLKPMMGLHPCSVNDEPGTALSEIEKILFSSPQSYVAIGEVGLDYYWDKTFILQQKETFTIQAQWANRLQLPLVIHSRDSIDELIQLLKTSARVDYSGVFHCFTGSIQQAHRILDLGFYLGIGGVSTFKNASIANVIKSIGLQHVVLETDAPYLAPAPYRGTRNEPSYIPLIAQFLSELCQLQIEDVAEITSSNARKLFNLTTSAHVTR
ncbi:MAG: TatD family hydrolase [Candidatus Competibacteraceae bacterium]|nr:TatD family hydrolase [Candidatus Competibacteraceae bacterium]